MSGEKGIVLRNGRFATALTGVVETLGPVMGPKVAAVLREAKEAIENDQGEFERAIDAKVAAIEERIGTGIHIRLVKKAELTINEIRERIGRAETQNGEFRERLGAEVTEFMNALATGLKFSRDQAYVDGVQANRRMEEAAKTLKAAELGLAAKEVELVGLRADVQEMREMILGLNAIIADFVEGRTENAPAVRSALEAIEKSLSEGQKTRDELLVTGREVRAQLAKLIEGLPKEKDNELRNEVAELRKELETMQTRKAVDLQAATVVEAHERGARTSDPPDATKLKEAQEAERNEILGKLADVLTDNRDSAVLKGLVAISNDHLDGIQSVLGVVDAEAGKLNESAALKEALGRLFAARNYRLDYDNMDSETAEKLAGKVSRAITLLERHLSHATTAEAETDATAVEREEEQFEQVKAKVDRFMEKFTELVVALNEQNICDDEFGVRVTADPQMERLEQLDAKLVQERLVKVAELIGEEVVAKVNGPLNLRTNGDLVASVESELRSRLQIIAEATSGVVSDAKIAEITGSW